MEDKILLANNLYHFRKQEGLSQELFAEKCGICTQQVSKIENMRSNVNLDTLSSIRKYLDLSMSELWNVSDYSYECGRIQEPLPQKEITIIETTGAPFEGVARYGIKCSDGNDELEISDISSNQELVECIIKLAMAVDASPNQVKELVEGLIGIIV